MAADGKPKMVWIDLGMLPVASFRLFMPSFRGTYRELSTPQTLRYHCRSRARRARLFAVHAPFMGAFSTSSLTRSAKADWRNAKACPGAGAGVGGRFFRSKRPTSAENGWPPWRPPHRKKVRRKRGLEPTPTRFMVDLPDQEHQHAQKPPLRGR
jgi:hypothetical protein